MCLHVFVYMYVRNPIKYFFYGKLNMAAVVAGEGRTKRAMPRELSKAARHPYFELSPNPLKLPNSGFGYI